MPLDRTEVARPRRLGGLGRPGTTLDFEVFLRSHFGQAEREPALSMSFGGAIFFSLLVMSAGLVAAGWGLTFRLTPDRRRRAMLRWLLMWCLKGFGLPVLLWAVMNLGISWWLQPFMPEIQSLQSSGGDWGDEFMHVLGKGMFIVSSYWCAGTLAWVLISTAKGVEEQPRRDFKGLCWTCCLGLGVPALLLVVLGGWSLLGLAAAAILLPMAGYAPGLLQPQRAPPMYARAIARIKFGKYAEAEWEIIRELEKCEDDFEGWMMLAELYATRFGDLAEAERTILELCDQPKLNPSQLSIALHRLADWYLKLGQDPDAARRALQMVCDRLPGTHLARMAHLRMNQLPRTVQQLKDQQSSKPIPLPPSGDALEALAPPEPPLERATAARLANACVDTLRRNPDEIAAREKLARLFSEQLERPDLGIEQLGLLLNMPGQTEAKRAEWLSLMAGWELKYRQDFETGRRLLQRLVEDFPTSPQAFAARRKLITLESEVRSKTGNLAPGP